MSDSVDPIRLMPKFIKKELWVQLSYEDYTIPGSTRIYYVEIEFSPTQGYSGEVVELPGCFVSGHTMDELHECIEEGIGMYRSTPERRIKAHIIKTLDV